jgi:signal transduction histidine kinase
VTEKAKQNVRDYEPTVSLRTRRLQDKIEINVRDNGNGIPASIKEKIFQPFFTTKPTGDRERGWGYRWRMI